tara:strand:+ start:337 stop:558 length:222 start_codon:yes stop_codon:yes gene_type:complete
MVLNCAYNVFMNKTDTREATKMELTAKELMDIAKREIISKKVEQLIEQVNAKSISIEKAEARAAELKAAYEAI